MYKRISNNRESGTGFVRSICFACGKNLQAMEGVNKQGRQRYKKLCWSCMSGHKRYPYRKFKKDVCEECGFIPIHSRQLDVHHVDFDKTNNKKENLLTLCSNCHRLLHIE